DLTGIEVEALSYEKAQGRRTKDKLADSELGREVYAGKGTKWLWKLAVELAIFDEVHRCGGISTRHSKMLIAARREFRNVLCLSATAADSPTKMKALGYSLGLFDLAEFKWWMFKHGVAPGVFGGFQFTDDPVEQRAAMLKLNGALFPEHGGRLRKRD